MWRRERKEKEKKVHVNYASSAYLSSNVSAVFQVEASHNKAAIFHPSGSR